MTARSFRRRSTRCGDRQKGSCLLRPSRLEPLDLHLRHEPSASHEKAPARQRTAASNTVRSPAGLEPGAWDRPWTGARSPPATRPRPTAPAPCAPRFHCSGAARLSCANRAHSVRKRGPAVFLWCGRPDLQRIWRPRPRNPPQLFRLLRQYPAAEQPLIDRNCTFDHKKKEKPQYSAWERTVRQSLLWSERH